VVEHAPGLELEFVAQLVGWDQGAKYYMSMCCSVNTLTLQFSAINFSGICFASDLPVIRPVSEAAMVLSDDAQESLVGIAYRPPARRDRVQVGVHVTEDVRDALKQLSLHQRMPVQVLLCQAINDLFEKHGIERLADETILPRGGAAQIAHRGTRQVPARNGI
jgi:hypothetical protein